MYLEFYLYGILIGGSLCSACALPLFFLSGGGKKTFAYLALARVLALFLALPLLLFLPFLRMAGSILMLGVGVYAFMSALEGTHAICGRSGLIASTLLCFFEGAPAVLLSEGLLPGILNGILFVSGTLTPLFLASLLKIKINNRIQMALAGLVIVIAIYYLYLSLFAIGVHGVIR